MPCFTNMTDHTTSCSHLQSVPRVLSLPVLTPPCYLLTPVCYGQLLSCRQFRLRLEYATIICVPAPFPPLLLFPLGPGLRAHGRYQRISSVDDVECISSTRRTSLTQRWPTLMFIAFVRTPSRASPWVSCGGVGPRYPAWGILFRGCTRCEGFVPPVVGFKCSVQSLVWGSLGFAEIWSICVRGRKPTHGR